MMGGSETVSGDKDGVHTTAIHVPIGWHRRVEAGQVIYVSPSGTALSSLDEVKTYLLTDGTCKCGLECPLIIHKVFNFTVGVKVEQHSLPLGKTEQDMTKLCNHRRKVVAMAALCRSMQASQLPFANLHHSEPSSRVDSRDPNGILMEREEEDRGIYHPKLHPVPVRAHNNFHSNNCASPKSSHQFLFPYNGSSQVLHTGTNAHHSLETLRRLHHPPSLPSSSNSSFPSYTATQRSPRAPTIQNASQGQRTPKTPETPGSPQLGPFSSPPPSSPMAVGGGGRVGQTYAHHPHGVIVGVSTPSQSPSISPSVYNMNCVSPRHRTRRPSASPSPRSEQGGGSTSTEGQMGCNLSQRRKSTSSSPHSPIPGGSPNPSPHLPKYKLEDILEQFKNSGNSSTNNHLLNSSNPSLLANQSSGNLHTLSSKPSKSILSQTSSTGPGFGLNSTGPSSLPLGAYLNHHHSHTGKISHPVSFPASNLLSAAAKAQLANQITQGQSSNAGSNHMSLPPSLEVLKEAQQQQSSKVNNSTLNNSNPSSSSASRSPHPSLAAASAILFPPCHPLAQTLASSIPHLPLTAERNASHRKRQRRSPTVLSMLRDTQQLANGPQKTPPGEAVSATVINLSSSSSPSSSHSFSSTSAVQNQNPVMVETHRPLHLLPGQMPRLSAPRQTAQLSRPPRPNEILDFTTGLTSTPLGLDPPTQPLSALLHLLSVQNAQATVSTPVSNSSLAQPGSVSVEGLGQSKQSHSSPTAQSSIRHQQTRSPCRTNDTNSFPQALSPPPTSSQLRSVQSHSHCPSTKSSPRQRHSASTLLSNSNVALLNSSSPSPHKSSTFLDRSRQPKHHISTVDCAAQTALQDASPEGTVAMDVGANSSSSVDHIHSPGSVSMPASTSPKPLDLSNHVLALLAASSSAPQVEGGSSDHTSDVEKSSQGNCTTVVEESGCVDPKDSTITKPPAAISPGPTISSRLLDNNNPTAPSAVGDPTTPSPLAEAFPFMNQEQLLQLLSSTGGLPSLLDPAVLASLPLGGMWLGGQQAQMHPASGALQTPQNLSEQQQPEQQQLLMQQETHLQNQDQQKQQQQHINTNPLFPLLPLLSGAQGELPLNLLGMLNPLLPPASTPTPTPGQETELGLTEKTNLQALLMASLLLGQQQAPLIPLSGLGQLGQVSLEVPLQQPQQIPTSLEGLTLDKVSGLLDPSGLPGPGLLEVTQGLLPIPPGAEGNIQSLASLLLPAALPPPFLPLNPALLTAALSTAELHPPPHTHLTPAQQTQHTQPQVPTDAGVDTLIPLSLQAKDNPILQQLLPTLLNPTLLGDLSGITALHNMMGLGAGSILLPPVQTSALGVPLLQGPDGAINLLNNIQLSLAPPSETEKPASMQETQSPARQENIPAGHIVPEVVPNPAPGAPPAPTPVHESTPPPRRDSEGRSVIDPYTSFMDTIYTSFLQVSAKEQEDGAHLGPSDPTSPFCALPPVSFPMEHHTPVSTLPQASAPVSLSPRRACSLRNPDLSRLSLEAAAHSPAQGTPKPTEDGSASPLQRKPVIVEGHVHPEPPMPPIFLEEAKTDCTGPPAAVCPFVEVVGERQGHLPHSGYPSVMDGCSGRPDEETAETLLLSEHERDQAGTMGGARRGRKRKQTLQNVLEDFREIDATALDETKATTALLKPERSVRGRRRRGARSQRQ